LAPEPVLLRHITRNLQTEFLGLMVMNNLPFIWHPLGKCYSLKGELLC